MFKRYDYSNSRYSNSFRKRRRQAQRKLAFFSFGFLLLLIIGAGLVMGSLSQNRARPRLAPLPLPTGESQATPTPALSARPSISLTESSPAPAMTLAPLLPVALSPQKWNWPLNTYNPEAFSRFWQYSDSPIQNGRVVRGWSYGAAPLASFLEPYKESQQGLRLVQYWEKGRLDISDPSKSAATPDYVSGARLVKELMLGQVQLGDKVFMPFGAARLAVTGEGPASENPALTYTELAPFASLKNDNRAEKQLESSVNLRLEKNLVTKDPTLSRYDIKQSYYSPELGHNIPNVFWEFLNRNGTVYQDGKFQTGRVYDWAAVTGLPLTEAYWTKAQVNRKVVDVLVQAFERRVLLYTPSNAPGFQVEWGNVGLHYFSWRYPNADPNAAKTAASVSNPTLTPAPALVKNLTPGPTGGLPETAASNLTDTLEIRLAVGNESIQRNFSIQNGRVTGSSLVNRMTGRTYSNLANMGAGGGFLLKLDGPNGAEGVLNGDQFSIVGYSMPVWNEGEKQIMLSAVAVFQGQTLNLKLYWRAYTGRNYIEKWLTLDPSPGLAGWLIRYATTEDLMLTDGLKAASPTPNEENLPILIPTQRNPNVAGGAIFTHVMVHDNQNEGFFFFSATPLGGEYALNKRVVMFQEEYQDLKDGFSSGKAIIGAYTGSIDLGFKRYTAYLQNNYSQMAGKRQAVWYHSWYPFTNEINQDVLQTQLDIMKPMGIYDLLHIDAGWESLYPLEIDLKKFPQGFKTLFDKGNESNIRLGIWINPFSNSYEQYVSYAGMHRDHPEWHVKGMDRFDPKKGYSTGPFSINSDYYFYVRDKLINLVKTYNIRAIYWDGADWNIPDASAPGLTENQRNMARVQGLKRLMALMDDLHKAVPDIIVVPWNSTADVHLLGSVEQLQLSDVWELPIGESELYRQQQYYASTYQLPYYSVWGDWYSISYKENKDDNLKQPIELLKYVETKMVGIGGNIAGASLDLTKAPPELLNHLKKLYGWRRKFEQYFTVYQHILNEPGRDLAEVTGEAHIINGAGFIMLNNSTNKPIEVNLPLSAPELELESSKIYKLYDWSNLESGLPIGEASPGEGVPVTVAPRSVKIIGVNIPGPNPASSSSSGQ